MANRKVPYSLKKKPFSFSIKTVVGEEFSQHCLLQDLVPSQVVQKLMETFNKSSDEEKKRILNV